MPTALRLCIGRHGPYTPAPAWERITPSDSAHYANYCPPPGEPQTPQEHERCDFGTMLKVVDDGMKNVTEALTASGRWEDTLMVVCVPRATSDGGCALTAAVLTAQELGQWRDRAWQQPPVRNTAALQHHHSNSFPAFCPRSKQMLILRSTGFEGRR